MSVSCSGRWIWYRSIQSVPSRRRLFSTSRTIHRRELPNSFGSSPILPCTLVARTTSSRRPPASALPTISSDSPREYTSAVSTKLTPASSARWMMRIDSSWSLLPQSPNIMAPRQSGLTYMPVRPRVRCSIGQTLLPGRRGAASAGDGGDRGGKPAGLGEREAHGGVASGDRGDRDGGIEADADDRVAAGGEVAGDGELLGGRAGDAQLAVGAAGGADGGGGGGDRGGVTARGRVHDDHETRRPGSVALGLDHEPGHEQRRDDKRRKRKPASGEKAGHTNDCNTYEHILQGRPVDRCPSGKSIPSSSAHGGASRERWIGRPQPDLSTARKGVTGQATSLTSLPSAVDLRGAGRSSRLPHHQLDRQRLPRHLIPRHQRGQRFERDGAQSLPVRADGGQRRRQHACERQVVEAHHGEILG